MTTYATRVSALAIFIAAFAVMALGVPSIAAAQAEPAVNAENFNTHSGSDYKGINVGWNVENITEFTEVIVALLDGSDNVIIENEGNVQLLNELLAGGEDQYSTPFITWEGSYDADADDYWSFGEWSSYDMPVKARITVNGITEFNDSLSQNGGDFEELIPAVNPENFNTHSGSNYEGINVGWNVANITEFEEVTVMLLDAEGNTLVTNEGNVQLLNELLAGGEDQYSTPFITWEGSYDADADDYWSFGEWSSYATPAVARIIVNGITVENGSLSENGGPFADMAPAVNSENFNTHSDTDYKGVNVGWNVENISEFTEVVVTLFDAEGDTLVSNEGNLDLLNAILVNGNGQFSTPFITINGTYNINDPYWSFGEWLSYDKPATAVITINGTDTEVTPLTEPNGWTYESLIPADTMPPVITLNGESAMEIDEGDQFTDPGATAYDVHDGDIVVVVGGDTVNPGVDATYVITYTATDEEGNQAQEIRTVTVLETSGSGNGGGRSSRNNSDDDDDESDTSDEPDTSTDDDSSTPSTGGEVLGATTYNFAADLWFGMTGEAVIELHKVLIAEGYLHIAAPTGYFGPLTFAAVKEYQAAHGIINTGYVGPLTRGALNAPATAPAAAE